MQETEKHYDAEKLIDEVLTAAPEFTLSDNFADVVTQKVSRRFAWQQYFNEFLIYLAAIVGLVLVWAALSFFMFDADWHIWLNFAVSSTGIVAGISIIPVFILFADRVLLRYFMFKAEG